MLIILVLFITVVILNPDRKSRISVVVHVCFSIMLCSESIRFLKFAVFFTLYLCILIGYHWLCLCCL